MTDFDDLDTRMTLKKVISSGMANEVNDYIGYIDRETGQAIPLEVFLNDIDGLSTEDIIKYKEKYISVKTVTVAPPLKGKFEFPKVSAHELNQLGINVVTPLLKFPHTDRPGDNIEMWVETGICTAEQWNKMLDYYKGHPELGLPNRVCPALVEFWRGMAVKKHWQVARFNPTYRRYGVDQFLLDVVNPVRVASATFKTVLASMSRALASVAERYVLSNGSFSGQLGRYVHTRSGVARQVVWPVIRDRKKRGAGQAAFKKFEEFLEKSCPSRVVYQIDADRGILYNDMQCLLQTERRLVKFNMMSESGLAMPGLNRENMFQNIQMAILFLKALAEPAGTKFRDDWQFAYLCKLKPKFEVMFKDNEQKKARNYFPQSVFREVPMRAVRECKEYSNAVTDPYRYSNSLYAITFVGGGACRLFERVRERILGREADGVAPARKPQTYGTFVYSDNYYVYSREVWISTDGDAFESAITLEDMEFSAERAAKGVFTGNNNDSMWHRYVDIYGDLCYNTRYLLGTHQLPGQMNASGVTMTLMNNHDKMYSLDYVFRTYKNEPGGFAILEGGQMDLVARFEAAEDGEGAMPAFSTRFKELMALTGVKLKLEGVCANPAFDGYANGAYPDGRTLYRTDLLGTDTVRICLGGRAWFFQVLQPQRLIRALAFNKTLARLRVSDFRNTSEIGANRLLAAATLLVKSKALYLGGGFLVAPFNVVLPHIMRACKHTIETSKANFDFNEVVEAMEEEIDSDTFEHAGTLGNLVKNMRVPTVDECFQLHLGPEDYVAFKQALPAKEQEELSTGVAWDTAREALRPPAPTPGMDDMAMQYSSETPTGYVVEAPAKRSKEKLAPATDDPVRGNAGGFDKFDSLSDAEKVQMYERAGNLLHDIATEAPYIFGLGTAQQPMNRQFDVAAIVSKASGIPMKAFLHEFTGMAGATKPSFWKQATPEALRHGLARAGAFIHMKTRNPVKEFVREFRRELETSRDDWAMLSELAKIYEKFPDEMREALKELDLEFDEDIAGLAQLSQADFENLIAEV